MLIEVAEQNRALRGTVFIKARTYTFLGKDFDELEAIFKTVVDTSLKKKEEPEIVKSRAIVRLFEAINIKTGEIMHFTTIPQAVKVLNIRYAGISECLKKLSKTSKGYKFRYL